MGFISLNTITRNRRSISIRRILLAKQKDPNYSLMRATINRGEDAHTDGKFGLSEKASMEIIKLFMTKDEDLYDKKITDVFTDEFLNQISGYTGEQCLHLKIGTVH